MIVIATPVLPGPLGASVTAYRGLGTLTPSPRRYGPYGGRWTPGTACQSVVNDTICATR